jgi:assimilatory nitrate reductase catalytic subunit
VITGDPMHPANFGRLCSKGTALGETLSFDGRLLNPMMRGADGALTRTSWDAALNRVAAGFRAAIDQHGPDAVALYVSGQMLTEDYYVANKLMKGFIGSANIDTNSRLCMASSVAGHKRAFGSDTVPGCYEDLDQADLAVLVGSNAAWCHPILHQRIVRNKRERGARIVVIDPRRTPTADEADLYLQIAPGTDSVLFCGLLVHLADADAIDTVFIRHHTRDFDESLACARRIAPDIDTVARGCGVPREHVACFFDWFCATPKAVTLFSQGVNQAAQGTDKVNAIINCHLATNRIGRPGMGPFSLTGQPNAMGGREVGGLPTSSRRTWALTPKVSTGSAASGMRLPSPLARPQSRRLVRCGCRRAHQGALGHGTNPRQSAARRCGAWRAGCSDLFVVSDVVAATDTISAGPHVLLPAAAWGEKDGTVTNSERRISRQRSFIEPPGEARPDCGSSPRLADRVWQPSIIGFSRCFPRARGLSAFENGQRAISI